MQKFVYFEKGFKKNECYRIICKSWCILKKVLWRMNAIEEYVKVGVFWKSDVQINIILRGP